MEKHMDGLSLRINEILTEYGNSILKYKKDMEDLKAKIHFYELHNLEEEKRIALIKFNSIRLIYNDFIEFSDKINSAVDMWNS